MKSIHGSGTNPLEWGCVTMPFGFEFVSRILGLSTIKHTSNPHISISKKTVRLRREFHCFIARFYTEFSTFIFLKMEFCYGINLFSHFWSSEILYTVVRIISDDNTVFDIIITELLVNWLILINFFTYDEAPSGGKFEKTKDL